MRIFFSRAAKAELADIAEAIAVENPARALRVVRRLREGCEGLADMPRRFQHVPRFEHTGVRRRVVDDYVILYRLAENSVQILHVLHGATDYAVRFLSGD